MSDSQSPEEGARRVLPEFRVTGLQPWSVSSFPPDNGHPSPTLASQIENTSRTINIKPNKRPGLKKKPYPSPLPEQIFASATQQMSHIQKRSSIKQNICANHEGIHKSINGKRTQQAEQVRLETIVGMIRGNTSRKRPRDQSEQWLDNEISFHSTPRCQLVDSPIILEALIEGFLVRRIYVDGGSSFENVVGGIFPGEESYPIGTINLNVTIGEPKRLQTIPMEFSVVKSHSPYNVILGRTGLRSLGAVASTIHSMIKFLTANGIATMITKRETLYEFRRMEEAQGPAMERRITLPRIQAPGSVGTTNQGKKEGRWQTHKQESQMTPDNHHPAHLRKTLKQMKKLRERMNTLKGHSKASLRRRWPFMTTIWTKQLLTEETCSLSVDPNSLKYYESMPMISLGLRQK
ncbi:hypothetical protein Tco_1212526 [Tanacetum coccineum]